MYLRGTGWDGTRHKRVEVIDALPRTTFTGQFLESADQDFLTVTDDLIRLQADNGVWVYRITDYNELADTYSAGWV